MPGFMICGTGAHPETQTDGRVETRRKYRWILQIPNMTGRPSAWAYLKAANRPKLTLGQIDQWHNQEHIWHEGKTVWNDLTCTFYDVESQPDVSQDIYAWLGQATYDIPNANPQHPRTYKNDVLLKMLKHDGSTSEQWKYCNAWPYDVDWGNLDYTSEELCEVAVIFKYDRAQKVGI
jgi:hypothetical protein